MRLLRRTAAVFFDLLGASLLARLSPLSSKVAKTRKWIKAYLLRTLSERREGEARLAAAPTPSQTFHALEATVAVSDSSWSLRPCKTVRSAAHIQMARDRQCVQIYHCNVVRGGAAHERA